MRVRIQFAKTVAMRYTSHLDLHRTWERTLRRSLLPLAYSQGFNPHPKINLASALPLGFTSQCELMDIWLKAEVPVDQIAAALAESCPPGIQIHSIVQIDERAPTLQTLLKASEYEITLPGPFPGLDKRVQDILEAESLPRQRRGKLYDLRPLILDLRCLADDEQGLPRLHTRLTAQEGATGRPEEVLLEIGCEHPEAAQIMRTSLIFES